MVSVVNSTPDEIGKGQMLHTFVSSQAVRFGAARLGVASFSVITHVSLITLAVAASGPRPSDVSGNTRLIPAEKLHFVRMRESESATAALRKKGVLARAVKRVVPLVVPDMTKLQAVADIPVPKVADVLTDIDLDSRITDRRDFGDVDTKTLLGGSAMWALSHPGRNGAYTQDVVERIAWPRRDNPTPRYPAELQRAGIEGTFVVQYVVDSTGRVDANTLAFPKDAQPGFLRAVKDALVRSRFFPAELAGMHVRQLVQQQFSFVIIR